MRRHALAIYVCVLLISQAAAAQSPSSLDQRIADLSQQIANKMTAKQKTTIAVIEFTDLQGQVTNFGRYLAEELITKLYDTDKFKVIERQLLNRIIAEQKLSLTGTVDPSSAKQLGKLLGVDALCSGTISELAQTLKVNGRLISTETGEIFAVASTEIAKDESVLRLLGTGTTEQAAAPKNPFGIAPKPKPPAFETESYRVTIDSIRKMGNTVSIIMFFESLSDSKFPIAWRGDFGETYLLDENGEKWGLVERDSGGIVWPAGMDIIDLLPGTRIKSKFTFLAKGDSTGKVFTLASIEATPGRERQVLIQRIKID